MASEDDLITTLKVQGLDAIEKAFSSLASAASTAFKAIDDAAKNLDLGAAVVDSLKGVESAAKSIAPAVATAISSIGPVLSTISAGAAELSTKIKTIPEALGGLVSSLGGLAGSIGGLFTSLIVTASAVASTIGTVALAIFGLSTASSTAIERVSALGRQLGITAEDMSALQSAFTSLGVVPAELERGFRRLAVTVQREWPNIARTIQQNADAVVKSHLDIQNSLIGLERAERAAAQASRESSEQRIADANSVRGAELSLAEAQERLRLAQGGVKDPAFERELAAKRAILGVDQARLALTNARQAAENNAADSANKEAEKELAVEQQRLQLAVLRRTAREAEANSIEALVKHVNALAGGFSTVGQNVNATAENIVRGIIASVGPSIQSLQALRGEMGSVAAATPSQLDVLFKLADVIKGVGSNAKQTAILARIFGEEVSQNVVRAMAQGSAGLKEHIAALKATGLAYTEADAAAAESFKKTQNILASSIGAVKDKIGAIFSPVFTQVLSFFNETVVSSFKAIEAAAVRLRDIAAPAVTAFINVLKGVSFLDFAKSGAGEKLSIDQLLDVQLWQQKLEAMKRMAVEWMTFVGNIFVQGFRIIKSAIDSAAGAINFLFSTSITGDELGIALLIGQFTGLNKAVLDVVVSVGSLGLAILNLLLVFTILAAANPFVAMGVAVVAFGVIAAAVIINMVRDWEAANARIQKSHEDALEAGRKGSEVLQNHLSDVRKDVLALLKFITDFATAATDLLNSIFTFDLQGAKKAADNLGALLKNALTSSTKEATNAADEVLRSWKPAGGEKELSLTSLIEDLKKSFTGATTNSETLQKSISDMSRNGQTNVQALTSQIANLGKQVQETSRIIETVPGMGDPRKVTSMIPGEPGFAGSRGVESLIPGQSRPPASQAQQQIQQQIQEQNQLVQQQLQQLQQSTTTAFSSIKTAAQQLVADLGTIFSEIAATISTSLSGVGEQIAEPFELAATFVRDAMESVKTVVDEVAAGITTGVGTAIEQVTQMAETLLAKLREVAAAAREAASATSGASGGGAGGGGGGGFARGGLFRGRAGRDTNLAWLTDMEYIMNPKAVRHWGVGFMDMINSLMDPSSFHLGGLFRPMRAAQVPAFAGGGLNRAPARERESVINLTLPGIGTFRNLRAPESTAQALLRAVVSEQITKTGVSPSWKK